jgi:hypothetical protein
MAGTLYEVHRNLLLFKKISEERYKALIGKLWQH